MKKILTKYARRLTLPTLIALCAVLLLLAQTTTVRDARETARQARAERNNQSAGETRADAGASDIARGLPERAAQSVAREKARAVRAAEPSVAARRGEIARHESSLARREPESGLERESEARPDRPDEAERWRMLQMVDENGYIPPNALMNAWGHAKSIPVDPRAWHGGDDLSSLPAFDPLAGIQPTGWTWLGPGNIGGRIRSIVIHPTDPQTMWIGSVGGGIWKTTNGGASWSPLADFMASLAVSSMAIDPTNTNVLYAGTGEGVYNLDAIRGAGIFKTTNGGTTWTQLSSTANTNWRAVNRIAISPANSQIILAATGSGSPFDGEDWNGTRGIWRSTDGGATWSLRLSASMIDIDFNPTDGTKAIASGTSGAGARFSTDSGLTWSAATGLPTSGRIEVAYSRSNPATVYASADNNAGELYRSTNGGQSYTLINTGTGYLTQQGWYANALWVDPTNSNVVVVGGLDLWRSTNGGANLTQISRWQSEPQSAHADHHIVIESPQYGPTNHTVFFGNDGGIYRASDVLTVSLTSGWTELNNTLGITQFYGGAGNPTSGRIVGGTQDNGTLRYTGGTETWDTPFGGDGGWCAADLNDPNYLYGEYVNLNIHRNSNGGASQSEYISGQYWDGSQWSWKALPYRIPDAFTGQALFIAPFVLDPNNSSRILAGGLDLWRTNDAKTANTTSTGPTWASVKSSTGRPISAVAVAKGNSNIVWVGHEGGSVYFTINGTASSPTWTRVDTNSPGLPDRYCTRITIDPTNSNRVYVTFGGFSTGNVWRTDNSGSTWTNITGNLPVAPVRGFAVWPQNTNNLYAGTEVGIFASADGGQTWSASNDGPTNCSVDELFWMNNKLVAVTHGRGMFSIDVSGTTPGGPANNNFASAQVVTGNSGSVTGSNVGANKESGEPDHAGNAGGASVWYQWQAPASGSTTITTAGSSFDTTLGVYTGSSVGALTTIASSDDENYPSIVTSKVTFNAVGGTTYRVAVDGFDGATGSITLGWTLAGGTCSYSISPTSRNFASGGGSNTVNVTAGAGCAWTAVSNASFITITAGASGTGGGTVSYSVTANPNTSLRFGTMTIAGQTFNVTQDAAPCNYSISPTSQSFVSGGGTGSVAVTATAGCAWTAVSNASFITITAGSSGSNNGTVSYSVAANTSTASRTGTMTVAGQTFTVTQAAAACTYSISPTSQSFVSGGGTGSITITTGASCARTAVSNATFITITGGASGTGGGTVTYSVAANASTTSRTGTITVAGQTFTVTQAGAACTYSISPTAQSFAAAAGSGSVTVTAGAGCAWTAASNSSFITISAGSPGTGNGTVSYSVAANTTTSPRTGTLTIAGQTFTVTQAGSAGGCTTTPISVGQTINGALSTTDCMLDDGSFFDRYTFSGTAGQQVAVSMSAGFDTFLFLLAPDGTEVARDDDGGGGTNSRIPAASGFLTLPVSGTYAIVANSFSASVTGSYTLTLSGGTSAGLQFSTASYNVNEGALSAVITLTRTGSAAGGASVDYTTVDDLSPVRCDDQVNNHGVAYARCDYATTVNTITFAPGETAKTFTVSLIDDAHVEGIETVQLRLSNPQGATLGAQNTATLLITDNDAPGGSNAILNTNFFVRMQYLDFLSREPEPGQPWSAVLNNCPDPFNSNPASPSANCDRIKVSAAFFGSDEFKLKGFFVFRFYKAAFGRLPRYTEIAADMAGLTAVSTAEVSAKKAAFTNAFAQRQEFKGFYDPLSNASFIDALLGRYGLPQITTPDPQSPDGTSKVTLTRADLVNRLNGVGGTLSRAQVVRAVADSDQVAAAEFNSAFVAMQYFGYLRRDPEPGGYADWLRTINTNPADIRSMVNGFMNSTEYKLRFGQP